MLVTVEGVITSIQVKEKDKKLSTEILLAQEGQKVQAAVRLDGNQKDSYSLFEPAHFTGQLLQWHSNNGIGNLVMVR